MHVTSGGIEPAERQCRSSNDRECLLIAPVLDNTPTEALEVIYDIKPLNLLLEKLAVEKYLNTRGHLQKKVGGTRLVMEYTSDTSTNAGNSWNSLAWRKWKLTTRKTFFFLLSAQPFPGIRFGITALSGSPI